MPNEIQNHALRPAAVEIIQGTHGGTRVMVNGERVQRLIGAIVALDPGQLPVVHLQVAADEMQMSFEEATVNAQVQPRTWTDQSTAERFAGTLNRALSIDPAVVNTLFDIRRECSKAFIDDPAIAVAAGPEGEADPSRCWLGMLGLINGMLKDAGSTDLIVTVRESNPNSPSIYRFETRPWSQFHQQGAQDGSSSTDALSPPAAQAGPDSVEPPAAA